MIPRFSSPRMALDEVLHHSEAYLLSSDNADVPLGWRIRLWDCMNWLYREDALLRRSVLAYLVARQTLSAWDAVKNRVDQRLWPVPVTLVYNCKRLILGEMAKREAQPFHRENDIEYAMSLFDAVGPPVWSVLAAYSSIKCASGYEEAVYQEFMYEHVWSDDFLQKCREEDDDWEGWDTHFWGAGVAGGMPGLPGCNVQQRREFWLSWLQVTVPSVLGERSAVMKHLN